MLDEMSLAHSVGMRIGLTPLRGLRSGTHLHECREMSTLSLHSMAARNASQFSMHCHSLASLRRTRALSTVQPWWSKALFRFTRNSD
eukprot:6457915-Amphidinium_carterae.1